MKKTLAALTLAVATVSTAQADTLLGLYAGVQGWNMEATGSYGDSADDLETFNFKDETKVNMYVALEHPIPLIPNIKIARTDFDTSGAVTLDTSFTFGNQLYTANSDLTTDVEVTNTDFILYYELFDNDLISFDLGIEGKYLDGLITVTDDSNTSEVEFSGIVPMVYSRAAIGLPFSGLGIYAEGSFLSLGDNTLTDYQAAITYSLLDNIAVDLTLQVGYRAVTMELEDLDDVYTNVDFKGPFAGIEVHF